MYGWLTSTGVKFVIIIDMEGKPAGASEAKHNALHGIREADLKPAFRALHTAYIRLLRNPFYDPDEHAPNSHKVKSGSGSMEITSPLFIKEVERIGQAWYPGISSV
ncbi:MAG: hypothetical protein M1831_004129 [Alyxoria varia]|nr:MAG: hypothetical protein M1831_004129 [Alyxoria varia]